MVVPISAPVRPRRVSSERLASELAAGFQAVPALRQSRSVEEMVRIAAEEHARAVHAEGR
jgi:hypothetical protein